MKRIRVGIKGTVLGFVPFDGCYTREVSAGDMGHAEWAVKTLDGARLSIKGVVKATFYARIME